MQTQAQTRSNFSAGKGLALIPALCFLSCSAQDTRPPIHFSYDASGFYAAGRWIPSDPKNKAAFPSETELDCSRVTMQCVEATAEYYYGHPHVSTNYWHILKWDNNGIVADLPDKICMTGTLLISFAEKAISETDSMKQLGKEKKEACSSLGASEIQGSLFVLKGSKRWNADQAADLK